MYGKVYSSHSQLHPISAGYGMWVTARGQHLPTKCIHLALVTYGVVRECKSVWGIEVADKLRKYLVCTVYHYMGAINSLAFQGYG